MLTEIDSLCRDGERQANMNPVKDVILFAFQYSYQTVKTGLRYFRENN